MANLFETTPIYVSISDLRDTTTNSDLKSSWTVEDWDVSILISKAQDIIDNAIWDYWVPNIENQETIFPIKNEDWTENTVIPIDIQKATVLLVENLYIWGVLDGGAYWVWTQGSIKSETSRGHTISYFAWATNAAESNEFLNEEIMIYLKPYILNLSAQWYK